MLETDTRRVEAQPSPDVGKPKVTCFVCKKQVERREARQLTHSREKLVWVCEAHIK
ncbi:MAG: hypothetical protein JXR96_24940 [Deltaproteobacteria bacterium]|nr:hypothetical protein [Deltaproteobacteria bacterium]